MVLITLGPSAIASHEHLIHLMKMTQMTSPTKPLWRFVQAKQVRLGPMAFASCGHRRCHRHQGHCHRHSHQIDLINFMEGLTIRKVVLLGNLELNRSPPRKAPLWPSGLWTHNHWVIITSSIYCFKATESTSCGPTLLHGVRGMISDLTRDDAELRGQAVSATDRKHEPAMRTDTYGQCYQ